MKEDLILIRDIRQGCYSSDPKIREKCSSGFLMQAGARYEFDVDPNWNKGMGYYVCGTHIILEQNLDWNYFIEVSKYESFLLKVKEELEND